MSEWIVKDGDCVPLPPHHVLRSTVDWLLYEYWCCVYGMTGVKVCDSHARAACCLASDWPKELGPLPQQPIKLEAGRRYLCGNGEVTGPLKRRSTRGGPRYPFWCETLARSFSEDGQYYIGKSSDKRSIVAEFHDIEPRKASDDINELAVEALKRENHELREQCRRQAELIEQLLTQQRNAFEAIEELVSKVRQINMW